MHPLTDWREQTTTSPLVWRGLPRSSLSACCLYLSLLSLAGDSSTVASLERRHSRRPEITELAVGSKEPGNLTSVALQSSPFRRQLAEWGRALTYIQRKCSPYHAAVFSCGEVNIPYDYELSCRASSAQRRTKWDQPHSSANGAKEKYRDRWVIGASCQERQTKCKQCKICAHGVTRSNKRVLRGSIIRDEENDATLKSEVFFNTTDGSSGRPVMTDKPNESSAKSVLTEWVMKI